MKTENVALGLGLPALVASVLLAGCGGSSPTATTQASPRVIAEIRQTRDDCSLTPASGRITPGLVAISVLNDGGGEAGVDVWRIPEGHTYDEVVAHVREERRLAEAGQPGLGHPSFFMGSSPSIRAEPRTAHSRTVSGELKAGTYAIICIRTFEQVGQFRPLAVVGPLVVATS